MTRSFPILQKWPGRSIFLVALVGAILGACVALFVQHWKSQQTQNALWQTDIPFLQMMNYHHDQAITLAELVLPKAQGQVAQLAHQIAAQQRTETGMFRALLLSWNAPVIPQKIQMDWMIPHATLDDLAFISRCNASGLGMEGLATMAQINELAQSPPDAANTQFLQLMAAHHSAALPMLDYARRNASTPVVRNMAASMWAAQRDELVWIHALLRQRHH
ncbi:MAG TPA: DUF305 domain-containing protein [Limnobacter sp.]|uniref:DUF305 domain-containing protein n=1 Tax=Limnobacter sp. TaxID=2003368 RepID=UPI002E2FF236|nr:DUF305 domain-containing protein [Limnobacter sp.]HEX5484733.1 DUF305 domain-containing protein [Limnobacter sp.]